MDSIITISNVNTGEYFFTTDHCQNHNLGPDWVSTTSTIPMEVVARECLPDGIIRNKEDYKKIFHAEGKEIPNPDPNFQS